jgi:GrpB-like predicted nucleotidyltransferase (UPF0157 family)
MVSYTTNSSVLKQPDEQETDMRTIRVVDYNPGWPAAFEQLRSNIWPAVADVAVAVEHVGSTSVPGLAAKPVIDISVVVSREAGISVAIERLAVLGYVHRGELGVEGREAFDSPDHLPAHHLYVCSSDSVGLMNHLAVRDYLRTHPETAETYGNLKKQLAEKFPHDIDRYGHGKTGLILNILWNAGLSAAQLQSIEMTARQA